MRVMGSRRRRIGSIRLLTFCGVALALASVTLHLDAAQPPPPGSPGAPILLTNAWLIDGTGAAAVDRAWVRIEGDRIAAMGQGAPPSSPGAQVIDLQGRTLLPGLADMHAHLGTVSEARYMTKMMLAHGITRLKETGNRLGNLAAIRQWLATDAVTPRVYMSGWAMQGDLENMRFLKEGREAQAMLDDISAFGVEFFKVYNWTSSQALKQLGDFARARNITLTGHVPLGITSIAGIDLGMQILEHVRLRPSEAIDDPEIVARYPLDLSVTRREGFWAYFNPRGVAIGNTLDALAKRRDKFFLDPTIAAQWGISHADGSGEKELGPDVVNLVSPAILKRWRESGSGRRGEVDNPLTPKEFEEAKGATEGWTTFVGLAHARGVRILSGTDSPVNWVVPGYSLHQELQFFVKAGMSPVEAIRCSTGRAAEAFRTRDRGTIAAGNVADLVIVQGNVAENIRNIGNVEKVILGGKVHERAELLRQAKSFAAADATPSQ